MRGVLRSFALGAGILVAVGPPFPFSSPEVAGYLTLLAASENERVRPEPFDAVELDLRALFGDLDDD